MPDKYTRSEILGILPQELTTADVAPGSTEPMSEVACDGTGLTAEMRRKKISVENSDNPARIIRKGK